MLKLNIGFNRKIGEANFSSRGASVNLEIEVESGVVREPDKLQAKIDYLFKLAKASVDAQLNGGNPSQQPQPAANNNGNNGSKVMARTPMPTRARPTVTAMATGTAAQTATATAAAMAMATMPRRSSSTSPTSWPKASAAWARRLESLTGRMFGKPLADLTSLDASSLIDTLKAIKEGRVSLDAALSEGTAA